MHAGDKIKVFIKNADSSISKETWDTAILNETDLNNVSQGTLYAIKAPNVTSKVRYVSMPRMAWELHESLTDFWRKIDTRLTMFCNDVYMESLILQNAYSKLSSEFFNGRVSADTDYDKYRQDALSGIESLKSYFASLTYVDRALDAIDQPDDDQRSVLRLAIKCELQYLGYLADAFIITEELIYRLKLKSTNAHKFGFFEYRKYINMRSRAERDADKTARQLERCMLQFDNCFDPEHYAR